MKINGDSQKIEIDTKTTKQLSMKMNLKSDIHYIIPDREKILCVSHAKKAKICEETSAIYLKSMCVYHSYSRLTANLKTAAD